MKYYTTTNSNFSKIHIVETTPSDFKIVMNDSVKKTVLPRNYCNAGFFANFDERNPNGSKEYFTLPVGHLLCDYDSKSEWNKFYCGARGKFNGDKYTFDCSIWSYDNPFYKKAISTLLVNNNKAEIKEIVSIPTGYNYAISGIPIVRDGVDVSYTNFILPQGWDSSPLYATWHTFIGLKKDSNIIYIIGMKTSTYNMVRTSEAYKKFEKLGMYNVIKLDGGGSFHMNVNGKAVASTYGNRRVNNVIQF